MSTQEKIDLAAFDALCHEYMQSFRNGKPQSDIFSNKTFVGVNLRRFNELTQLPKWKDLTIKDSSFSNCNLNEVSFENCIIKVEVDTPIVKCVFENCEVHIEHAIHLLTNRFINCDLQILSISSHYNLFEKCKIKGYIDTSFTDSFIKCKVELSGDSKFFNSDIRSTRIESVYTTEFNNYCLIYKSVLKISCVCAIHTDFEHTKIKFKSRCDLYDCRLIDSSTDGQFQDSIIDRCYFDNTTHTGSLYSSKNHALEFGRVTVEGFEL